MHNNAKLLARNSKFDQRAVKSFGELAFWLNFRLLLSRHIDVKMMGVNDLNIKVLNGFPRNSSNGFCD